jgi:hypothetical protein
MAEQDRKPGGTGSGGPEQYRVPDVDDASWRETPSQAEGDRESIEQDLAEKLDGAQPGSHYATGGDGQGDIVTTPSQAEGERGEVDEDLREKGED